MVYIKKFQQIIYLLLWSFRIESAHHLSCSHLCRLIFDSVLIDGAPALLPHAADAADAD